jgi:hypothetical protein
VVPVTVRQRIDQLAMEDSVGDLGYAADQRLVARALLGVQLLADEIDGLKAHIAGAPGVQQMPGAPQREPVGGTRPTEDFDEAEDAVDLTDVADVADQLAALTDQIKKLTKAVKKSTAQGSKKKKKN